MYTENRKAGSIVLAVILIFLPLVGGMISAAMSGDQMVAFSEMNKPALSPPGWLFPIAWSILYILMGMALLLMVRSRHEYKVGAICLFISQLVMNYVWTPIFFGRQEYWTAFVILILMWLTTIICAIVSRKVDMRATLLLIPLILWETFAAYLNAGVAILN